MYWIWKGDLSIPLLNFKKKTIFKNLKKLIMAKKKTTKKAAEKETTEVVVENTMVAESIHEPQVSMEEFTMIE